MSSVKRTRAPNKPLPPVEYLRECFYYTANTGLLRWRARPRWHFSDERAWSAWNTRFPKEIAGCLTSIGYRCVLIKGRPYWAHRIIWKLMTGKNPAHTIDHIDRNRANNAWTNLREATTTEQAYNAVRNNAAKHRGVSKNFNKFEARIKDNGIRRHIGMFDTPEKASKAVEAAARKLHGEFYRSPSKHRK